MVRSDKAMADYITKLKSALAERNAEIARLREERDGAVDGGCQVYQRNTALRALLVETSAVMIQARSPIDRQRSICLLGNPPKERELRGLLASLDATLAKIAEAVKAK